MTIWAIVPVKPLRRGKSRLASVLADDERVDLNRRLLSRTLDTLTTMPDIEHVLVISRDPEALSLARDHGARTVQEDGAPKLNAALQRATILAKQYATSSVLIVPADLPLFTSTDIKTMLERGKNPPVVVVAPDRRGRGTNALLVNPAGCIQYDFGPDSFARHCRQAEQIGARLEIVELPSLALDMDLPEDLDMITKEFEGYLESSDLSFLREIMKNKL